MLHVRKKQVSQEEGRGRGTLSPHRKYSTDINLANRHMGKKTNKIKYTLIPAVTELYLELH